MKIDPKTPLICNISIQLTKKTAAILNASDFKECPYFLVFMLLLCFGFNISMFVATPNLL